MGNVVSHVVGGAAHLTEDAINAVQDFLHHIDADHHGKEWLEPVVDEVKTVDVEETRCPQQNIVHWKSLDEWKQHYEPMDVDESEQSHTSKLQQEAKRRAKLKVVDVMQTRMTHRIFRLVLDVVSSMLSVVEEKMQESKGETSQAASSIINNLNGILLTYRFQRSDKSYKMEYMRRVATDSLTTILWEECRHVETALGDENGHAKACIMALRKTLHDTVASLGDSITHTIVEEHLDKILAKANDLQERVANKTIDIIDYAQSFEERLAALDVATRQAGIVADQIVGEAADSLDIEIEKVDSEGNVETTVSPTKAMKDAVHKMQSEVVQVEEIVDKEEKMLARTEEALDGLQESMTNAPPIDLVIKDYILKRFHQDDRSLTRSILRYVDHLLLEYYEIYASTRLAMAQQQKTHRYTLVELQEKMYQRVDNMANIIYDHVHGEVAMASRTLGAWMVHHEMTEEEMESGR